jgi:hypothetical protein
MSELRGPLVDLKLGLSLKEKRYGMVFTCPFAVDSLCEDYDEGSCSGTPADFDQYCRKGMREYAKWQRS